MEESEKQLTCPRDQLKKDGLMSIQYNTCAEFLNFPIAGLEAVVDPCQNVMATEIVCCGACAVHINCHLLTQLCPMLQCSLTAPLKTDNMKNVKNFFFYMQVVYQVKAFSFIILKSCVSPFCSTPLVPQLFLGYILHDSTNSLKKCKSHPCQLTKQLRIIGF